MAGTFTVFQSATTREEDTYTGYNDATKFYLHIVTGVHQAHFKADGELPSLSVQMC